MRLELTHVKKKKKKKKEEEEEEELFPKINFNELFENN